MEKLIALDITVGLILAVANFYIQFSVDALELSGLTFLLFLSLVFVNFLSIFTMWRKYRYFSFIPFVISLIFVPLLVFSGFSGHKLGIYNKPSYPDKYFNEERKKELTAIAEELLGAQDEKSKRVIEEKLNKHRLVVKNIDRYSNIVELYYDRSRIMSIYIFAKDGLPEIYSIKPIITENDIPYWDKLIDIIKTENNLSKYSRDNIVWVPEIVYPFLVKNLDKTFVDKLAAMETYDDFAARNKIVPSLLDIHGKRYTEYCNLIASKLSKEEKLKVIEILNQHCQISSRLIEDSNISWKPMERSLDFCGYTGVSSSFHASRHLQQLISDGVISRRDREGHLQVKPNLSDKEIREIEWLQVEIMRHIYGNLVRKEEYWSNDKTKLADNWYFYVYRE